MIIQLLVYLVLLKSLIKISTFINENPIEKRRKYVEYICNYYGAARLIPIGAVIRFENP